MHDHTAALTGSFASRQYSSLTRPVKAAAMFGAPMTELCVLRPSEDIMTADALKKIVTGVQSGRAYEAELRQRRHPIVQTDFLCDLAAELH